MSKFVVPLKVLNVSAAFNFALPTDGMLNLYFKSEELKKQSIIGEKDIVLDRKLDNFTLTTATPINYNDTVLTALQKIGAFLATPPLPQVNSDWNATSGVAKILNKPTLGSAAGANITDFAAAIHNHNLSNLTDVNNTNKGIGRILKVSADGITHEYVNNDTGTDEKVKYKPTDPTAGYVEDKIIAGDGISVAEGVGVDENKLIITNTDKGSDYVESDPVFSASEAALFVAGDKNKLDNIPIINQRIIPFTTATWLETGLNWYIDITTAEGELIQVYDEQDKKVMVEIIELEGNISRLRVPDGFKFSGKIYIK